MTSPRGAGEPEAVARAFLGAYNEQDLETIETLLALDITMTHHGRGVDLRGRDTVLASLAASASGAFPDRTFQPPARVTAQGERVVIEHAWTGTATRDVDGFARAGESVRMEVCTVFTVRDGLVSEYTEYG